MEKTVLLVAEGETDIIVFESIAKHLSTTQTTYIFSSLAPQKDATSGSYPSHGFGEVLNWCLSNKNKIQMLMDFKGASALFVQMDTDIAHQINKDNFDAGFSPRQCCENKLNELFKKTQEPERCYYILPTENTETWLLGMYDHITHPNIFPAKINNYEQIIDTGSKLIAIGYPSKKKGKRRVFKKEPAKKHIEYAQQLVENLPIVRQRCPELERLCHLISHL